MGAILTRTQKKHPTPVLYAISIHLVGKMQLQCISYFEYTQMISSIFSLGLTAIIHTFEYALSIASHQPSRFQTWISLHLNLCCSICDFDVDYMATDVIYSLVFIFGTTTRPLVPSHLHSCRFWETDIRAVRRSNKSTIRRKYSKRGGPSTTYVNDLINILPLFTASTGGFCSSTSVPSPSFYSMSRLYHPLACIFHSCNYI